MPKIIALRGFSQNGKPKKIEPELEAQLRVLGASMEEKITLLPEQFILWKCEHWDFYTEHQRSLEVSVYRNDPGWLPEKLRRASLSIIEVSQKQFRYEGITGYDEHPLTSFDETVAYLLRYLR